MDQYTLEERFNRWRSGLEPIYGDRETKNMWRFYLEANRSRDLFETDLQKLANQYPIQYLTGFAYFYGEKFAVNEHSLIPRPETEELVYKVLEDHSGDHSHSVIDLGTGTGCIPITLKKQRPHWSVSGLELYPDTLKIAVENARSHHVKVDWIPGDILSPDTWHSLSHDVIISNPPYIRPDERSLLEDNVIQFEPHQALFTSDPEGLEFYRAIASAGYNLASGTEIYLEIHPDSADRIASLFRDPALFSIPEIFTDMQGRDRILRVVKG